MARSLRASECGMRRASRRRFGRLLRLALLARLGRIERRVLLAAQGLARELDQVVRRKSHAEHGVDLAALERRPGGAPEFAAIIGAPADARRDVPGERGAELDARPGEAAARRRPQ